MARQVNSYLDRSFLTDVVKRKTENDYLYLNQSSFNIATEFLKFRDWNKNYSIYKYRLNIWEKKALIAERAVLKSGFSHGEKRSIIMMITGLGGEKLLNLLEKATAKIFVLEYFFNIDIEIEKEDYLYEDLLKLLLKEIGL